MKRMDWKKSLKGLLKGNRLGIRLSSFRGGTSLRKKVHFS